MCRLCEGASWDDVIADARRQIAANGYMSADVLERRRVALLRLADEFAGVVE
jgi:hypothetical protein